MPDAPELGFVTVWSDDPPVTVIARLSDERPDVSAGYGGWEEVERPRRSTVTTWKGQPARRMTLGILLDGFRTGTSVEQDISQLEAMALPRPGGQPPVVHVKARGNHVPYQTLPWVIEGIAWGDTTEMNAGGDRTRQAAALSLLEYVTDELIRARKRKSSAQQRRARAAAKRANKRAARQARQAVARSRRSARKSHHSTARARTASVETVDAGEDLMSIAARELGDARRWREIADLNGIRDPRAVRIGQILRMP